MKKSLFFLTFIAIFGCANGPKFSIIERTPSDFKTCFEMMTDFFAKSQLENNLSKTTTTSAKNLDELEDAYGHESLIEIQKRYTVDEIKKSNEHLFELLKLGLDTPPSSEYTRYVNHGEALFLLFKIQNSKVNQNKLCYDPTLTTGFCFGRATIGHMEALIRGLHPKSIKKIWIAGDMQKWGHHVANMVKTEKGWLVIDTNINRAVPPEEWLKAYLPLKAKEAKEIMVFVTRAERFAPYDNADYTAVNLFNTNTNSFNKEHDFYRGYFHDYFEELEQSLPEISKLPIR